jgi:hypothetical protein
MEMMRRTFLFLNKACSRPRQFGALFSFLRAAIAAGEEGVRFVGGFVLEPVVLLGDCAASFVDPSSC